LTQPFFSIIVPTFNRADIFPLAVRSILRQTFDDYEVIISDNCSTDATPEAARQFTDSRVRYVRTPEHYRIADSWEFAWPHASGRFILMLSDDDALAACALRHFHDQAQRHAAEFLFSCVVEYCDNTFPGTERNSVSCPAFSGTTRRVSVDEFVGPFCAFRPLFHLHPSAFVFAKSIADRVGARIGRFFWTNGVEYSAWLMTAVLAKAIVHIDLPLAICGHTSKSWTSNILLCNSGKEPIQQLLDDIDRKQYAPLHNVTMSNMMAEGILLAKMLFAEELARYEFNELNYVRGTISELKMRKAMGVEVSTELEDALRYARKYPSLCDEMRRSASKDAAYRVLRGVRSIMANGGGREIRRRINAFRLRRALGRRPIQSRIFARGKDFGFHDVLGCAAFIDRVIQSNHPEHGAARDVSTPALLDLQRPGGRAPQVLTKADSSG